jgi:hypothetical protein
MIIGGVIILISLITYCLYKPKQFPKGSVAYYKKIWN